MPTNLSKVKQILNILNLDEEKISDVIAKSKTDEFKGKFFGQIAVESGYATELQLQECLRVQASSIAEASYADIQLIMSEKNPLEFPPYMKPHWGNNIAGENPIANAKIAEPTLIDSGTAAANVGKQIVLLANKNHSLILENDEYAENIFKGVKATKILTDLILNVNTQNKAMSWASKIESSQSSTSPMNDKDADELLSLAKNALMAVASADKVPESLIKSYTENRFAEIQHGVDLAIDLNTQKESSKTSSFSR